MSKIEDMLAESCPDGVEFKRLGDVGTFTRGSGLQKKDFAEDGIGCIHYGQIYTYYGTSTSFTKSFVPKQLAARLKRASRGDLVLTTTSETVEDVCKAVAWLGDEEIAIGGHSCVYKHELDPMYVAYYFQSDTFQAQKRKYVEGTKVKDIKLSDLARITIPVPPATVQRAIVEVLDKMEQLQAELEAELERRKTQYTHYRDTLLTFERHGDIRRTTLAEIGKVAMCKRIFKHETTRVGDIPFFKIGTFGGSPDAFISRDLYERYKQKYSFPKTGDILISAAGTIGRTVVYDGRPAYFQDSNIVWIDNDESVVINAYLRYWYDFIDWSSTDGGTIKRLYNDNILSTEIAVPPLDQQKRIVTILDQLNAFIAPLSGLPAEIAARRKQFEYYRDRLLTFPEKVTA